jgi:hypothetical protein
MTPPTPFSTWAVVDLLGHQRIAGHLTEQAIAGYGFIRVEVPAVSARDGTPHAAFTRYLNPQAIYAITPLDEPIVRALAADLAQRPIDLYDLPALIKELRAGLRSEVRREVEHEREIAAVGSGEREHARSVMPQACFQHDVNAWLSDLETDLHLG